MTTVKITVTAEDIKDGLTKDCYRCPIAQAVNRHLSDKFKTEALTSVIIIVHKDTHEQAHKCITPSLARRFISDFDAGNKMHPVEFDLEIPSCYLLNPPSQPDNG